MIKSEVQFEQDSVYFIPLGGCGVFGSNLNLYGYNGKWIMVDCGMAFADETMPGIDVLLPDLAFVESIKDDLLAIVLTHGHFDHIGAIEYFWPKLKCPIYTTGFTVAFLKQVLMEHGWGAHVPINKVELGDTLNLEPFNIEFIPVAHSIPEASSLAIQCGNHKKIIHTGDWKIDPQPLIGKVTDENRFKSLGKEGILTVVGDSTNAMVPGHSGSEKTVLDNMTDLFGEFKDRIVVTLFSSNVARIRTVALAAKENGRSAALVGRSLWRIVEAAKEVGYLKDIPDFLTDDEVKHMPKDKVVIICTGSQGEPRAALSRIAEGNHPRLELGQGDVVIFSSRAIPGNARAIDRTKNRLAFMGVEIITDRDAQIHVSGHPYREEIKQLFSWLKPDYSIVVHGEQMQQEKHAALSKDCGIKQSFIPANGQVLNLTLSGAELIGEVPSGTMAVEGKRVVRMDHDAIATRRRIMYNGSAVVTIVLDSQGELISDPQVSAMGLIDENSEVEFEYIEGAIQKVIERLESIPRHLKTDDEEMSEAARIAARRYFFKIFNKKPQTRVHLVRI